MKKILITEDDSNLRKLYELKFIEKGFSVELAKNGIECNNKALNSKLDVILLDLMMPQRNGFDSLKILKENKKTKNIPVVVLSNLSQTDDIDQVMDLGAEEYIIKSKISLNDLVETVKKHLDF